MIYNIIQTLGLSITACRKRPGLKEHTAWGKQAQRHLDHDLSPARMNLPRPFTAQRHLEGLFVAYREKCLDLVDFLHLALCHGVILGVVWGTGVLGVWDLHGPDDLAWRDHWLGWVGGHVWCSMIFHDFPWLGGVEVDGGWGPEREREEREKGWLVICWVVHGMERMEEFCSTSQRLPELLLRRRVSFCLVVCMFLSPVLVLLVAALEVCVQMN